VPVCPVVGSAIDTVCVRHDGGWGIETIVLWCVCWGEVADEVR